MLVLASCRRPGAWQLDATVRLCFRVVDDGSCACRTSSNHDLQPALAVYASWHGINHLKFTFYNYDSQTCDHLICEEPRVHTWTPQRLTTWRLEHSKATNTQSSQLQNEHWKTLIGIECGSIPFLTDTYTAAPSRWSSQRQLGSCTAVPGPTSCLIFPDSIGPAGS